MIWVIARTPSAEPATVMARLERAIRCGKAADVVERTVAAGRCVPGHRVRTAPGGPLKAGHDGVGVGHDAVNGGHDAVNGGHDGVSVGHDAVNVGHVGVSVGHDAVNVGDNVVKAGHDGERQAAGIQAMEHAS